MINDILHTILILNLFREPGIMQGGLVFVENRPKSV